MPWESNPVLSKKHLETFVRECTKSEQQNFVNNVGCADSSSSIEPVVGHLEDILKCARLSKLCCEPRWNALESFVHAESHDLLRSFGHWVRSLTAAVNQWLWVVAEGCIVIKGYNYYLSENLFMVSLHFDLFTWWNRFEHWWILVVWILVQSAQ